VGPRTAHECAAPEQTDTTSLTCDGLRTFSYEIENRSYGIKNRSYEMPRGKSPGRVTTDPGGRATSSEKRPAAPDAPWPNRSSPQQSTRPRSHVQGT
jgi:hypothetical protein